MLRHNTLTNWAVLAVVSPIQSCWSSNSILTEINGNVFTDVVILNESITLSVLICRCLPRHFRNSFVGSYTSYVLILGVNVMLFGFD